MRAANLVREMPAVIPYRIVCLPVLYPKNIKAKTYRIVILSSSLKLYECETWSVCLSGEEYRLSLLGKKVLRKIFLSTLEKITGDWRKFRKEKLHYLYSSNIITDQFNEGDMGESCGTHRRKEKCMPGCGVET
jgi:hypothetical protein